VLAALRERTPWLWQQLQRDNQNPALLRAWGRSINFDEHARAVIVAPALITALHRATGQTVTNDSVHAGVEHTYGYLFSTVETPYGYKRERWVSGVIERGMGLPPGLFGAQPTEGTLLANVTAFLSRCLGRPAPEASVARALDEFDYQSCTSHPVIRERVPAEQPKWQLVTHLLPLAHPSADGHYLLVYEAVYADEESPDARRLITAFPIGQEFATTLLSSAGTDQDIRPRYNAFLPGFGAVPRKGERVVQTP
jgi:hypothetical protein